MLVDERGRIYRLSVRHCFEIGPVERLTVGELCAQPMNREHWERNIHLDSETPQHGGIIKGNLEKINYSK